MSSFTDFCTDYFRKYFELHPTEAIYYGIEGYDHLLNDYSDETYKTEKAFVGESLDRLHQVAVEHLAKDQAIDYALLEGRLTIQRYEYEKEDYRLKWPDTYLAGGRNLYSHCALNQRSGGEFIEPFEPDTQFDPARHRQSQPTRCQSTTTLDTDGRRQCQGRGQFSREPAKPSKSSKWS